MMMRKLVVLGLFLLLPIAAAAQTADEVIGKYLEARGGLAKIRAIRSERVSGTSTACHDGGGSEKHFQRSRFRWSIHRLQGQGKPGGVCRQGRGRGQTGQ